MLMKWLLVRAISPLRAPGARGVRGPRGGVGGGGIDEVEGSSTGDTDIRLLGDNDGWLGYGSLEGWERL